MNSFGDMAIQFIGQVVSMALVAIFIENFIFTRALGSSTALVIIRKKNSLILFSVILTAITVAAGLITYFLQPLINSIPNKGYYIPLIYVAVIGFVYIAALFVSGMLPPHILKKIKPMIHISAFNCVVLGVLLLSSLSEFTLASFLGFGLGTGIGFSLATFFISIAYDYLHSEAIPKAFRGFPILLIYIGMLSLAFYGMIGHELPF